MTLRCKAIGALSISDQLSQRQHHVARAPGHVESASLSSTASWDLI